MLPENDRRVAPRRVHHDWCPTQRRPAVADYKYICTQCGALSWDDEPDPEATCLGRVRELTQPKQGD